MSKKHQKIVCDAVKQETQHDLDVNRTISLFPGVFDCLVKWNEEKHQYFDLDAGQHQSLTTTDKLWTFPWNLRLVCSDWNKAIESYYGINSYKKFKTSRHLKIQSESMINVQAYTKFLQTFGPSVESIFLEVEDFDESAARLNSILMEILKNLTNLKSLSICHEVSNSTKSLDKFDETVRLNFCQEFTKLKSLYLNGRLSPKIINAFLISSKNIESLRLLCLGSFYTDSLDFSINYPFLTELQLDIKCDENFEQLKRFGKNWKIKNLTANCMSFADMERWQDIFKMIGDNWSDSLQVLWLHLPKIIYGFEAEVVAENILMLTANGRLELPKLKTIQILTGFPISLDFLLPSIKSLESIDITGHYYKGIFLNSTKKYSEVKDTQLVEYLGFEKNMDGSNIWSWFEKLQRVR